MEARHRRLGGLTIASLTAALLICAPVSLAGDLPAKPPAAGGAFTVEKQKFTVGQAPDWLDNDHLIWSDEHTDGEMQTYRSALDGSGRTCLTCGLKGPNQVPVVQPGGDWILFHGWSGHAITIGGPGFGGLGSDIWVMRKDGSQRTNLTKNSEGYDNFHAYWSPDGRYIEWSKLNFNPLEGGVGKSDVRVARFEPNAPGGPKLVNEHVVRPQNGRWYETQWWAPDGSGFLYTETADTSVNLELYFCRLPDPEKGMCQPQRLTKNLAWDEQAAFTPDMSRILFMSSRDNPGLFNDWSQIATALGLPAELDYITVLPVFEATWLQPILEQANDLYEMTLKWNADHTRFEKTDQVRRLTNHGPDGWIIPEFAWDPSGTRLLWTESKWRDGIRVDQKLELAKQVQQLVDILKDPHSLTQGGTGPATLGQPDIVTIQARTFIGRYAPAVKGAGGKTCLANRATVGTRGVGRIRVGATRAKLLSGAPAPSRRTKNSWRWCVKRSGASVRAVFGPKGKAVLVASTAPGHHAGAIRAGRSATAFRAANPRRVKVAPGVYRPTRRSTRLVGVRGRGVAFVAVAPASVRGTALRRALRSAGL